MRRFDANAEMTVELAALKDKTHVMGGGKEVSSKATARRPGKPSSKKRNKRAKPHTKKTTTIVITMPFDILDAGN